MTSKKIIGLRPCTWVFVILIVLTFITFYVGEMQLGGLHISLVVLLLAMIKGHLVGAYFMGLGRLKSLWRWPVTIWLILPGALITSAFVFSV